LHDTVFVDGSLASDAGAAGVVGEF
jgi:hypothetical protein